LIPASSKELVLLNASHNRFTGWAGVEGANRTQLQLDFDCNSFQRIPAAMQYLPLVTSFTLRHNLISELPDWGNFRKTSDLTTFFEQMTVTARNNVGDTVDCWWQQVLQASLGLQPPNWDILLRADLSHNPIHAPLWNMLVLFGTSPLLSQLQCENCSLTGKVPGDEMKLVFTRHGEICILAHAFPHLQVLNLKNNPRIDCSIVAVALESKPPFHCKNCPLNMRIPPDRPLPLDRQSDCICNPTLRNYEKRDLFQTCGCEEGHFMNKVMNRCEKCNSQAELCQWGSNSERSIEPPLILPGYWALCQKDWQNFTGHDLYKCYSKKTCLGWTGLSYLHGCRNVSRSQCAQGRGGPACSMCLPGNAGGVDGRCKACKGSPEAYRRTLMFSSCGVCVLLFFLIHTFGDRKKMSVTILLRQLRRLAKILVRHLQVMTVIVRIPLKWPLQFVKMVRLFGSLNLNLDFFPGCIVDHPSVAVDLSWRWLLPAVVLTLAGVVSMFSFFAAACARHVRFRWLRDRADKILISTNSVVTFFYMLWNMFFATLTQNTIMLWTCTTSPNGRRMVRQWPHLECLSAEWWSLFPGSVAAFIIYVAGYVVVSIVALKSVVVAMKNSRCTDRGTLAFVADGLRDSQVHFQMYTLMKDLALNVALIALSNVVAQTLASFLVLGLYAFKVIHSKPFDTYPINLLEAWLSVSIVFMLLFTMAFGLGLDIKADSVMKKDQTESLFLLTFLFGSVLVPFFLILCELFTPLVHHWQLHDWLPRSVRPETQHAREQRVRIFMDQTQHGNLIPKYLTLMDHVEWDQFCRSFYGSSTYMEKTAAGETPPIESMKNLFVGPCGPRCRLTLADSELRSVLSRRPFFGNDGEKPWIPPELPPVMISDAIQTSISFAYDSRSGAMQTSSFTYPAPIDVWKGNSAQSAINIASAATSEQSNGGHITNL